MGRQGISVKQLLQRSEVSSSGECGRMDCMLCRGEQRGMCSKEGVGYIIWCSKCESDGKPAIMHGETGRCARKRIGEHFEAYEKGKNSNLLEHCEEIHGGVRQIFKCKVTRSFQKPLSRQLDEALRIQRETGVSMNDKSEWTRPAGYRVGGSRM